jgi:pimeloyl-ACP methyl ester carboxylesterase
VTGGGDGGGLEPPPPARRTQVISADGVVLNVELHGPQHPGVPTLVLIHGWTCSVAFWAPVIRALRGQFRVVAYDQRGHGGSDHPGHGGCSIEALAGFVPALAAAQHWLITSAAPLGPVSFLSRSLVGYLTLGRGASAELATVNAAIIQACDRRARAAWGHVLARLDVTAGVRRLDVPTRVLVGQADRLTPPVHARQVARQLPRLAGLTELPGVGHMTPLETPGGVAALIRKLATRAGEPGPGESVRPGVSHAAGLAGFGGAGRLGAGGWPAA